MGANIARFGGDYYFAKVVAIQVKKFTVAYV